MAIEVGTLIGPFLAICLFLVIPLALQSYTKLSQMLMCAQLHIELANILKVSCGHSLVLSLSIDFGPFLVAKEVFGGHHALRAVSHPPDGVFFGCNHDYSVCTLHCLLSH
jgi:hypothetical protein